MDEMVRVVLGGVGVDAEVILPEASGGVVAFANESASSSRRDRPIASALRTAGLGTVRFTDPMTGEVPSGAETPGASDEAVRRAGRLAGMIDWLAEQSATAGRPVGLFGADVGAAAAFVAAAERPAVVRAVVGCGERFELAIEAVPRVPTPSLLIVDEDDEESGRRFVSELPPGSQLETLPGATRLLEDSAASERVAQLAAEWFGRHLGTAPTAPASE